MFSGILFVRASLYDQYIFARILWINDQLGRQSEISQSVALTMTFIESQRSRKLARSCN